MGGNIVPTSNSEKGYKMLDPRKLEDIAKQINDAIPPGVKSLAEGFESKTKQILQSQLSKLDLVSREEFDVQTQVLMRTREKLEQLEVKLTELEKQRQGEE